MLNLREYGKTVLDPHCFEGMTAVDFTVGNGYDTLWLSRRAGASGTVFGFDLQKEAVARTEARLNEESAPKNWKIFCASHSDFERYGIGPFDVGVFNLGFLPGGDKTITTKCESSVRAVSLACNYIKKGGVLLVAVYPGHEEGRREAEALPPLLSQLDEKNFSVSCMRLLNSPDCQFYLAVERNPK